MNLKLNRIPYFLAGDTKTVCNLHKDKALTLSGHPFQSLGSTALNGLV